MRFGQHFLRDKRIARRIIGYANLGENEVVLEVGPGFGILTRELAKKAKEVIAVEKDDALVSQLENTLAPNVNLICDDILKISLPKFDKVISNLPYQISSPFTLRLLNERFKLAILTYQREFAERMVATEGKDYGRLSVAVYYKAEAKILEFLPKSAFSPMPKVESAVVRLKPRKPPFQILDEEFFFNLVKLLFSQRRKKVRSILMKREVVGEKKEKLRELCSIAEAEKRPEQLSPAKLGELANLAYEKLNSPKNIL